MTSQRATGRPWLIGRCTVDGCLWHVAMVREDKFTTLRVTEQMIEHTQETDHPCREETYFPEHHEVI